jgi:hypothetical protein
MPPFDQTKLQQTFQRATDVFNSGDYEHLRPLLHLEIVCKMLRHAGSVTGLDDVTGWLKQKKANLVPSIYC